MRQSLKYSEKVSQNITLYEATKSNTAKRAGFDNIPNEKQLINMRLLAENVFEPLRAGLGNFPIYIASFFRILILNILIGGAKNSQHMAENGAAMDIDVDNSGDLYNYQVFNYILEHLEFDQLIWEYGDDLNPDWVHVSYKESGNRKQALRCYKDESGKTKYKTYTP
jgi:hypothetical protein